jgi:anti-anti-sigma factor
MSASSSGPISQPPLYVHLSKPTPAAARAAVVGDVDLATEATLRELLLGVMGDRTCVFLEVDLAGVGFLDCAGIGALVAVRNVTVHEGRTMHISRPRPNVARLLDLTGLLRLTQAPVSPV